MHQFERTTSLSASAPWIINFRALLLLILANSVGAFLFGLAVGPYYADAFPSSTAFQLTLGSLLLLWFWVDHTASKTTWWFSFLVIGVGYFIVNLLFPNDKAFALGTRISPVTPWWIEMHGLSGTFFPWRFTNYLDLPIALAASRLRIVKGVYLGPGVRLLDWGVISKICFFMGASFAWIAYGTKPGFAATVYLCFMTIPYFALAEGARRIEQRIVQRARDTHAVRTLVEVLRRDPGNRGTYSLYLRPFSVTGVLPLQNVKKTTMPLLVSSYSQEKFVDLETMLTKAVGRRSELVALGSPGEMYGAGRIHSSEVEWFTNVCYLAQGAETIFIIPAASPGTLKEIQWLHSQGLFCKSIFIMPAEGGASKRLAEKWAAAQKELPSLGVNLPEYDPKGLIFVMDSSGEMTGKESFPLTRAEDWRKTFSRLRKHQKYRNIMRTELQKDQERAGLTKSHEFVNFRYFSLEIH